MILASPHTLTLTGRRSAAPTVVALVAHARLVPSLRRESFAQTLLALPQDPRRVVVRTCHRAELYASGDAAELAELADLPAGIDRLVDVEAVRHLLTVSCGLDSAVFGETQILHQLRETVEDRHGERALDPVLDRLFQVALRAGREARAWFTGAPRSLADLALNRIEAIGRQPLAGGSILVVGAGRMARLAVLAARRRDARIIVSNRTAARALELASEVDGRVIPFGSDGVLDPVAGVVVAVGGHWPLGDRDLETLELAGTPVVDLSSPPALDRAAEDRLADRFVSVDDLAAAGEVGPDARIRARLERLISETGGEFCQWLRARGSVPAIRAVVGAAEDRRNEELAWLRRRLPDLPPDDLALVEQMSHRLVASILHAPLTALTADRDGSLEPAARELFGV